MIAFGRDWLVLTRHMSKEEKKQMMSWKCRFYILFEQDKVEIYSLTDFQVKLGLEAFFTRTWSDIIK
jgi:hypothetical protein